MHLSTSSDKKKQALLILASILGLLLIGYAKCHSDTKYTVRFLNMSRETLSDFRIKVTYYSERLDYSQQNLPTLEEKKGNVLKPGQLTEMAFNGPRPIAPPREKSKGSDEVLLFYSASTYGSQKVSLPAIHDVENKFFCFIVPNKEIPSALHNQRINPLVFDCASETNKESLYSYGIYQKLQEMPHLEDFQKAGIFKDLVRPSVKL
jgi:hypothetical protein